MSNRWISQDGAGTLEGTSFANRAPISDFVAQEAAVASGEFLYFSAETITLPFVLTRTGEKKRYVGVNATTGINDGSMAVLDAGNTYANCITGANFSYLENIEAIRSTGNGLNGGGQDSLFNCKARNCGGDGIQTNTGGGGSVQNCHASNNTGIGIDAHYTGAGHCTSTGNGTGYYSEYAFFTKCIAYGNTLGFNGGFLIDSSVIDGNTIGLSNVGRTRTCFITKSSITNNSTGISTDSAIIVYENRNYFYNNTAKLGGTTANIFLIGGSIDGIIDPYINRAGGDFKPSATAPGLGFTTPFGLLSDPTNISYENMGLNPAPTPPAMTVTDINPATGLAGASIVITGTNFTGSGNIVKLGGSGGTSCTVTAQSTTSITFTVPAIATGTYDVYIETSIGANILLPNGFILTSSVVPVCAGITHFEILSCNMFYARCATATNTPEWIEVYIDDVANPFTSGMSFRVPYQANKDILIAFEADHYKPLTAGVVYYCGMRAVNANGADTNTAVLSNICSGSAMIQRMNNTYLVAK